MAKDNTQEPALNADEQEALKLANQGNPSENTSQSGLDLVEEALAKKSKFNIFNNILALAVIGSTALVASGAVILNSFYPGMFSGLIPSAATMWALTTSTIGLMGLGLVACAGLYYFIKRDLDDAPEGAYTMVEPLNDLNKTAVLHDETPKPSASEQPEKAQKQEQTLEQTLEQKHEPEENNNHVDENKAHKSKRRRSLRPKNKPKKYSPSNTEGRVVHLPPLQPPPTLTPISQPMPSPAPVTPMAAMKKATLAPTTPAPTTPAPAPASTPTPTP